MSLASRRCSDRSHRPWRSAQAARCLAALLAALSLPGPNALAVRAGEADGPAPTTAWKDGRFHIDVAGVVGGSDVVLLRPPRQRQESMPLGNGRLGVAVWAEDGYTAQLNRADTMPKRLSPAQVVIPGLSRLAGAADYRGRLDLYNGEFVESGAGMTAITYVDDAVDVMVVEVRGADPGTLETAELRLWPPRRPAVIAAGGTAALEERWRDTGEAGATGRAFGCVAGVGAAARDVHAEAAGPLTARLSFRPKADGSFTIYAAAPGWTGADPIEAARALRARAERSGPGAHRAWWHRLWSEADLMRLSSPDHSAEYLENLRAIDIFTTVAEGRGRLPGGQAGIGDLFSSYRDSHHWGPSSWWHWNLRMQVSANLGAGLAAYNRPYFNLYNDNLASLERWTQEQMGGRPGICIPETMRFNGPGYENESWLKSPGINCSESSAPYYNARTISTGAEVALWVWQQYLYTDDRTFLASHYPLMREAARFLLAYGSHDASGRFSTYPSNAHETNWDVRDPATDVSAEHALFPVVIEAAKTLGVDAALRERLEREAAVLPQLPEQNPGQMRTLGDGEPRDQAIIANSYMPAAPIHNQENIGLEPVWPYGLIGDEGPMHDAAVRTYLDRPNRFQADWSADPEQAARLGLAAEMKEALVELTRRYQAAPSGLAHFSSSEEFYVEQVGVVADAVQSALVQDYDGLLRILPAWPADWSADGSVSIPHRARVYVQVRDGRLVTLGIRAGARQRLRVRNPWRGGGVRVVDASDHSLITRSTDAVLLLPLEAGRAYLLEPAGGAPAASFAAVSGVPACAPRHLESRTAKTIGTMGTSRTIGLDAAR